MEERQEAAINGRRSQNSERVRAHLYERGFRQEPDRRVLVGEVDRGLTSGHRRRAPQGHGRSAVPPDDSDMHLGRERPQKTRLGTVFGGWQRGSLTPQMPPSPLPTAAQTATRAAKSAALSTRAKLLIVRNIAEVRYANRSRGPRVGQAKCPRDAGGTTPPASVVPPFFLRFPTFGPASRRKPSSRLRMAERSGEIAERWFDPGAVELDIAGH